jgi:hypothetical protein
LLGLLATVGAWGGPESGALWVPIAKPPDDAIAASGTCTGILGDHPVTLSWWSAHGGSPPPLGAVVGERRLAIGTLFDQTRIDREDCPDPVLPECWALPERKQRRSRCRASVDDACGPLPQPRPELEYVPVSTSDVSYVQRSDGAVFARFDQSVRIRRIDGRPIDPRLGNEPDVTWLEVTWTCENALEPPRP